MDKKKSKDLYKYFKENANYASLGLYFDDRNKQFFAKEPRWEDCRLVDYDDVASTLWHEDTKTINKGHPIIGSIIGNTIGGFAAGMAGAIIGQQTDGKKQTYIVGPTVDFMLCESQDFTHVLLSSSTNQSSFIGKEYKKQAVELQDKLARITSPWMYE